jgi:predicted GNAT family N-acyltransferase
MSTFAKPSRKTSSAATPNSVLLNDVPPDLAQKLPRYPTVPAALIGWLARHHDFRGCGLGELLLFDAIKTVAGAPIGTHAIFAHAIDRDAADFYAAYGFVPLTDSPRKLYLPIATALKLFGK